MSKSNAQLTEKQARELSDGFNKLIEQAQDQLDEYKEWLVGELAINRRSLGLANDEVATLISAVKDIRLASVMPETAIRENGTPTISVVYEYPDMVHAFLSRTDIPKEMQVGGITLDETPVGSIHRLPDTK